MEHSISVKVITQKDLLKAKCFHIPDVVRIVEDTLRNYREDNLYFPDKVSMVFDETSQNRINCLPAGFADKKIYGAKWVSVFPNNPKLYDRPNLSAVSILSELITGFPLAFVEGTLASNLRTAAIGAVAAKYLARKNSGTIGFIGAGEQAKAHFMTMKYVYPGIRTCYVSSRSGKTEGKFVAQLSKLYPDVDFVVCNGDYRAAVVNADIIVTAISGQETILKAEWIKEGSFYCHVAGLEDEYAVAQKASKIVVDMWDVVKHRTQTISRMYNEGILSDEDIYGDLYEILQEKKSGRESESEFIYFNSVGLSFIDTAVIYSMYQKVVDCGLGMDVVMSEKSMFECDTEDIFI